jgi:hypothetical protein
VPIFELSLKESGMTVTALKRERERFPFNSRSSLSAEGLVPPLYEHDRPFLRHLTHVGRASSHFSELNLSNHLLSNDEYGPLLSSVYMLDNLISSFCAFSVSCRVWCCPRLRKRLEKWTQDPLPTPLPPLRIADDMEK